MRPKGLNWSEWKKSDVNISRREVIINKTWEDIDKEMLKEEKRLEKSIDSKLSDKIANFFLELVGKEKLEVDEPKIKKDSGMLFFDVEYERTTIEEFNTSELFLPMEIRNNIC